MRAVLHNSACVYRSMHMHMRTCTCTAMHMHMHMHAHVMEKGTSCSEKEVASATGGDTAIDQES